MEQKKDPPADAPPDAESPYRPHFKHYITGKVYYAADYGHRAFKFRRRKKK